MSAILRLHHKVKNLFLFAQVLHKNHQHLKCQVLDTWEDMWGTLFFRIFRIRAAPLIGCYRIVLFNPILSYQIPSSTAGMAPITPLALGVENDTFLFVMWDFFYTFVELNIGGYCQSPDRGKTIQTTAKRKLEIIRLFWGVARRQIRSIVNLCEEFGVRCKVQKETIRIIL